MRFPIHTRLKDGTPVELVLAGADDLSAVQELHRVIIEEGTSYPHKEPFDAEGAWDYWFSDKRTVGAYVLDRGGRSDLVGMFYLKANFPGRAGKVANAGFIVAPEWRSRGLGRLLGTTMLEYAKSLGFHSVLFNLVFSENHASRRLWKKLGFVEIGSVPKAVQNDDGTFQDAIIMFRSLTQTMVVTDTHRE
ncbi:MAG: GNAT family N-acetyltransferase [Nitrospira sp.]|nr:GNAT family N-acetyltransferase [Nitrospira sp.]MDE0404507.1 GNAT family N-acetyltransferase [Nitrospira sp.]MDE0487239.1 GNAT family N-acetyltransferase [Nitrospira sp.]